MKVHEYQAKGLLAEAGAAVPRGVVASTPAEAVKAFDQIGGPVVLKAQIHAGGRGKGRFKDSGADFGETMLLALSEYGFDPESNFQVGLQNDIAVDVPAKR